MMQIIKICTVRWRLLHLRTVAHHQRDRPAVPAGSAPSVSWDGTYRGMVQITALGSGWLAGVIGA